MKFNNIIIGTSIMFTGIVALANTNKKAPKYVATKLAKENWKKEILKPILIATEVTCGITTLLSGIAITLN